MGSFGSVVRWYQCFGAGVDEYLSVRYDMLLMMTTQVLMIGER